MSSDSARNKKIKKVYNHYLNLLLRKLEVDSDDIIGSAPTDLIRYPILVGSITATKSLSFVLENLN